MATLTINEQKKVSHIEPEVYGHFSEHLGRCIYGGLFVGETSPIPNVNGMRVDVVNALKELRIPVLRWPGGCFADEYHWQDGIGPREQRKRMVNTHWGGVVEDNAFGTHEYFELCRQLGCKTYINGNVGSGTVREMSEWVEYMTFDGISPMAVLREKNGHKDPWRVNYFGVGNENWGCGGNMNPDYYANLYRHYQTYVRHYNHAAPIKKICCGANVDDYDWTNGVLETTFRHSPEEAHGFMDGLSLHYYVHPTGWKHKGSATEFSDDIWYKTMYKAMYMDTLVTEHGKIMDQYDPDKEIGMVVDEWGGWYEVEPGTNPGFLYQQNTIRDALIAGVTLNIFNQHSDRVKMACLAQVVNVLQAVILTEGPNMIKTPTYHVMHMYRHHQDADLLESRLDGVKTVGTEVDQVPQVSASSSMDKDGNITVTLANLSAACSEPVDVVLKEAGWGRLLEARVVASDDIHDCNTFQNPNKVEERDLEIQMDPQGKGFHVELPAASVAEVRFTRL